jgi:hypothetical protein
MDKNTDLTILALPLTLRWPFHRDGYISCANPPSPDQNQEGIIMRFVKVKDEERAGEVAINLDLVREAHFGGGLLHLYFERSSSAQDDMTFTGENAQKIWAAMG